MRSTFYLWILILYVGPFPWSSSFYHVSRCPQASANAADLGGIGWSLMTPSIQTTLWRSTTRTYQGVLYEEKLKPWAIRWRPTLNKKNIPRTTLFTFGRYAGARPRVKKLTTGQCKNPTLLDILRAPAPAGRASSFILICFCLVCMFK